MKIHSKVGALVSALTLGACITGLTVGTASAQALFKGCGVGYTCIYTPDGWSRGIPVHPTTIYPRNVPNYTYGTYLSPGTYTFRGLYGSYIVFNNQYADPPGSQMMVYLYSQSYGAGNILYAIPRGCAMWVNMTPVNSLSVTRTSWPYDSRWPGYSAAVPIFC